MRRVAASTPCDPDTSGRLPHWGKLHCGRGGNGCGLIELASPGFIERIGGEELAAGTFQAGPADDTGPPGPDGLFQGLSAAGLGGNGCGLIELSSPVLIGPLIGAGVPGADSAIAGTPVKHSSVAADLSTFVVFLITRYAPFRSRGLRLKNTG